MKVGGILIITNMISKMTGNASRFAINIEANETTVNMMVTLGHCIEL